MTGPDQATQRWFSGRFRQNALSICILLCHFCCRTLLFSVFSYSLAIVLRFYQIVKYFFDIFFSSCTSPLPFSLLTFLDSYIPAFLHSYFLRFLHSCFLTFQGQISAAFHLSSAPGQPVPGKSPRSVLPLQNYPARPG